jgi:hypothetical protein
MAKRFTDTDKWGKSWFRKLTPKMKCTWEFLRDNCDMAGIWDIDLESIGFHVGEPVSLNEIRSCFGDRITLIDKNEKLMIVGFIDFQYGTLSEDCKPHRPVLKRLEKLNLLKGYRKGFKTLEDKEQDKDKDQYQDKEKEQEAKKSSILAELEQIYKLYPRKEGKALGLKRLMADVEAGASIEDIKTAAQRYRAQCVANKTEPKYIKLFSTWASTWMDCLEPDYGAVESFSNEEIPFIEYAKKHQEQRGNA